MQPDEAMPLQHGVVIVEARAHDVAELHMLVETSFRGESSRGGWTTEADLLEGPRTTGAELRAALAGDRSLILCARGPTEQEPALPELLGCVHVADGDGGCSHLGMLAVRPSRQRRGVGRLLVESAERVALERWGATCMQMLVLHPREELIAWYERLGYRRSGATVPFRHCDSDIVLVDQLWFEVLHKQLVEQNQ